MTREVQKQISQEDFEKRVHVEIADVYSPPRITNMVEMFGMKSGFALDLTTNCEDGKAWDISISSVRVKALKLQEETKERMLALSPACTMFSTMRSVNISRMDKAD